MAHIRFWKRIKIFPGVYLNFGKKGMSISFGPRGFKYTVGTKGKRVSAGLPGTGLYYINQTSKKNQSHNILRPNASYSFISLSFVIKVILLFIDCQIINLSKGSLCLILGSLK